MLEIPPHTRISPSIVIASKVTDTADMINNVMLFLEECVVISWTTGTTESCELYRFEIPGDGNTIYAMNNPR